MAALKSDFCFAPETGLNSDITACLKRAIFSHPADGEVLPANLANTFIVSHVLVARASIAAQAWGMLKAPQIHFCRASDGVRIAHATTGSGPAMIEVATWLNHLEFDWQSPVWRPRLVEMAKNYTMARYDGRGCGLSDRIVEDLSFDANLRDLEAVAAATAASGVSFFSRLLSEPVAWRLPTRLAIPNA